MHSYIILHNMIVDEERKSSFNENYHAVTSIITPPINHDAT
jgi:hypothetical protein